MLSCPRTSHSLTSMNVLLLSAINTFRITQLAEGNSKADKTHFFIKRGTYCAIRNIARGFVSLLTSCSVSCCFFCSLCDAMMYIISVISNHCFKTKTLSKQGKKFAMTWHNSSYNAKQPEKALIIGHANRFLIKTSVVSSLSLCRLLIFVECYGFSD